MIRNRLSIGFGILLILVSTSLGSDYPLQSHKCGFPESAIELRRGSVLLSRGHDNLTESYVSEDGHFKIHYTFEGRDSVSTEQGFEDSVPIFVIEAAAAAERSYSMLTEDYGYSPPPSDGDIDGPELDIYIAELGSYYGWTRFDSYVGSPSYLEVDNNFSESWYNTHGLEALRVTIAHELFHAVQIGYSIPVFEQTNNVYWFEISSVWFEDVCYPDVNDYISYTQANFLRPQFPELNTNTGYHYGHGLFGQVLDKEYGWAGTDHIITSIWEDLEDREAIEVIDATLNSDLWNASLAEAMNDYALYNVFTGSRALAGEFYEDAALLPEIWAKTYVVDTDDLSFSELVEPLTINTCRIDIGEFGWYDARTNLSFGEGVIAQAVTFPFLQSSYISPQIFENNGVTLGKLTSQDYCLVIASQGPGETAVDVDFEITGELADITPLVQRITPNPFSYETRSIEVEFINAHPGILNLYVYNILGHEICHSRSYQSEGIKSISLDLPAGLAEGVYITAVKAGGKVYSRRFLILK